LGTAKTESAAALNNLGNGLGIDPPKSAKASEGFGSSKLDLPDDPNLPDLDL